jgi:hypothetical protein
MRILRAFTLTTRTGECEAMFKSREGQQVPKVTFPIRVNDEWHIEPEEPGDPFKVYIDAQHIGGADELATWLAK